MDKEKMTMPDTPELPPTVDGLMCLVTEFVYCITDEAKVRPWDNSLAEKTEAARDAIREYATRLAAAPQGWKPTPENINALPAPIRQYVMELETLCDPAGIVRENMLLKDCNRGLQLMYRKAADAAPAASSPEAADERDDDGEGPLRDGWQVSIGPGHAGYGVYVHMTDYPEEGAVCLCTIDPKEYPAALAGEPAVAADEGRDAPPFGSKRKAALALYRPPFKFTHGYIFDAGGQMVADQDGIDGKVETHIAARVRGWGRIGYMPDPEALQDEVGAILAEALTAFWPAASHDEQQEKQR